MKIFKFFITKIMFTKPVFIISMTVLLFLVNYFAFIGSRSIISTLQGYQEIQVLNKKGSYIANLDPNSDINTDKINKKDTQKIYNYLNKNYNYAFQADGFVTELANNYDMEETLNYINEAAYNLNQYDFPQNNKLYFNYDHNKDDIPVVVGPGIAESYPIGTSMKIQDSVLNRALELKVNGVLNSNTHRSNFYAPNSKNYYNFSIFVPANKRFINDSNVDLQLNGLMDLVLLESTKKDAENISKYVEENLNIKLNFFSQKENFQYFERYYINSIKIIGLLMFILIVILLLLALWNISTSIKLMTKEFTINLLVGMSYARLRTIFYYYFGLLFLINIMIIFLITLYSRYQVWLEKDAIFATYGTFGLIDIDWIALLIVTLIDIVIGIIIVELSIKKLKKIPISLGVLQ